MLRRAPGAAGGVAVFYSWRCARRAPAAQRPLDQCILLSRQQQIAPRGE